eukprot:441997-Pleurochrysis_carterae.AAC.1
MPLKQVEQLSGRCVQCDQMQVAARLKLAGHTLMHCCALSSAVLYTALLKFIDAEPFQRLNFWLRSQ